MVPQGLVTEACLGLLAEPQLEGEGGLPVVGLRRVQERGDGIGPPLYLNRLSALALAARVVQRIPAVLCRLLLPAHPF